jgi:hypothetical protein
VKKASRSKLRLVGGRDDLPDKIPDPGKANFECPMCKAAGRESGTLMQIRVGSKMLKDRVFPGRAGGKLYCPTCFFLNVPGLFSERGLVAVRVGSQWEKVGTGKS